jgi:hypothetical protein
VSPAETEGQLVYRLGNGQWDDFPAIGPRVVLLNARRMRPGPHAGFLVLAIEDVTDLRRAADEAARATAEVAEAHRRMSRDLPADLEQWCGPAGPSDHVSIGAAEVSPAGGE